MSCIYVQVTQDAREDFRAEIVTEATEAYTQDYRPWRDFQRALPASAGAFPLLPQYHSQIAAFQYGRAATPKGWHAVLASQRFDGANDRGSHDDLLLLVDHALIEVTAGKLQCGQQDDVAVGCKGLPAQKATRIGNDFVRIA